MNITTFAVKEMGGTPFPCHISEYMRTVIFKIPSYYVQGEHLAPYTIKITDDFKATVVTDPVSSILSDGFLNQRSISKGFGKQLKKACEEEENNSDKNIFVAIQLKEDLGLFPAVDGQCARFEFRGVETYMVFDCSDARAPFPDNRSDIINVVLSAARAELEVTDALDKVFDASCYSTKEGKCVYSGELTASAHAITVSPITSCNLSIKSQAIGNLVARIESGIEQSETEPNSRRAQNFGTLLEELIKAIQLNPTRDDAYLRLWYLQLWDRVEEFGKAFRPRLQLSNYKDLSDEKKHRNDIAHYQVDKLDWHMFRSLQKKVFALLRQHL